MAKSQQTFNKSEKEKKRLKKRELKQKKKVERKANAVKGAKLEDMFVYAMNPLPGKRLVLKAPGRRDCGQKISPDGEPRTEVDPLNALADGCPVSVQDACRDRQVKARIHRGQQSDSSDHESMPIHDRLAGTGSALTPMLREFEEAPKGREHEHAAGPLRRVLRLEGPTQYAEASDDQYRHQCESRRSGPRIHDYACCSVTPRGTGPS